MRVSCKISKFPIIFMNSKKNSHISAANRYHMLSQLLFHTDKLEKNLFLTFEIESNIKCSGPSNEFDPRGDYSLLISTSWVDPCNESLLRSKIHHTGQGKLSQYEPRV